MAHSGSYADGFQPLFIARSLKEFIKRKPVDIIDELVNYENSLAGILGKGKAKGFCIPCGKAVTFRFDMKAGGRTEGDAAHPNWRESLICSSCNMSNRQRLIAALIIQHLEHEISGQRVYLMEQKTRLFKWVADKYKNHSIAGSEYFGPDYQGGSVIGVMGYQAPLRIGNLLDSLRYKVSLLYSMLRMGGIRHEDVTDLSFSDESLDMIVSNDVFEHVPDPIKAFSECSRVLKSGGLMLATIPFHYDNNESISRAKMVDGRLEHLLPPMYHGNPVSADGSLVFTDFGWDLLEDIVSVGFSDVSVEFYASEVHGHLGGGQLVFKLVK